MRKIRSLRRLRVLALLPCGLACSEAIPLAPVGDESLKRLEEVTVEQVPEFSSISFINDRGMLLGVTDAGVVLQTKNGKSTLVPGFAIDMNQNGVILGGDAVSRWLMDPKGSLTRLPTSYSWVALNNLGTVVGHRWDAAFTSATSALYSPSTGVVQLAGSGAAMDLNDYNEVAGFDYYRVDPNSGGLVVLPNFPVMWTRNGEQVELDPVDLNFGANALAINNRGEIVGWAGSLTPISAVRWRASEPDAFYAYTGEYLSGGGWSQAFFISEEGLSLGIQETGHINAPWRGWVWLEDKTEVELGALGGLTSYPERDAVTYANGMNNRGEVVGASPLATPPHNLVSVMWTIPKWWWRGKPIADRAQVSRSRALRTSALTLLWSAQADPSLPANCSPGASTLGVRAVAACARLMAAQSR